MKEWFRKENLHLFDCFVVDDISICFSQKILDVIIDKYENEFGCGVRLKNVKLNCDGSREYSYDCDHPLLEQFRAYLKEWIGKNDFPVSYTMLTNEIRFNLF